MAKKVFKINLGNSLVHELPMGAEALHADYQPQVDGSHQICVWFLCDDRHRRMNRAVLVAGTGWTLPDWIERRHYVGSARNPNNRNCWHVFDLGYVSALKPHEQREAEAIYQRHPTAEERE